MHWTSPFTVHWVTGPAPPSLQAFGGPSLPAKPRHPAGRLRPDVTAPPVPTGDSAPWHFLHGHTTSPQDTRTQKPDPKLRNSEAH
jgi:hypothetical protein